MTNLAENTYNADAVALFLGAWFASLPSGELCEVRPLNKRRGQKPLPQSWHSSQDTAEEYIKSAVEHGDDVYIGALPRRVRKGGAEAIGSHCWLWADVDYGNTGHAAPAYYPDRAAALRAIQAIQLVPTILVETGGGFHVWYALSHAVQPDVWQTAARRLRAALNADAAATDPPRILRVPGTANRKTDTPRLAVIAEINPQVRQDVAAFLSLPDPDQSHPEPERPQLALIHGGKYDRPFERAKDVPISEVMAWLGVPMHREGQRVYSACPAHNGKNQSQMVIGGTANVAHCFGDCGRSYTTVDIVSAVRGTTSREAVNLIAREFGFDGFADVREPPPPATPPPADDWRAGLIADARNMPKNTYANYVIIMRNYEEFKGRFTYNEMSRKTLYNGQEMSDSELGDIRCVFEHQFGMSPTFDNLRMAVLQVSRDHPVHPLRNYLTSLQWDGEQRIKHVAGRILRAYDHDHPELPGEFVFRWFVAAAARGLQPGCKVDSSLVLVGPQRARKSTFFRVLGGDFFSDTYMDIRNKDALVQLHSAWIYEWGEIERYTRSVNAADIKGFMTADSDSFRAHYDRTVVKHPRSSVIVGTTNVDDFLDDETGSRRFWAVRVGHGIDTDLLRQWRDQLWAEAVVAFQDGAQWWLDERVEGVRAASAMQFESSDIWTERVAEWVDRQPPSADITNATIARDALGLEYHQMNQVLFGKRISKIMTRLGWAQISTRYKGAPIRVWRKP